MNCGQFQETVFDRIDGSLSSREIREGEDHLASCPSCRELLETIRHQERILTSAEVPPVPPGLWHRVEAGISPSRRNPAKWGWAAAAAAVLVAGLLFLRSGSAPEWEVVKITNGASETIAGFIPGFEEPETDHRLAGALIPPGRNR